MLEESYGSSDYRRRYIKSPSGRLTRHETHRQSGIVVTLTHFFRTVFLPQGYPESVSEDYLTYQIWDTLQAFASSITGTLAAQALLKGVGVGDESATVMAATLTWLLKDGTGMTGRILFAWMQGTSLDCDAKRWRFFADILNDIAIFMEILAPHFPSMFTFIVCIAGMFKSIVGVAGGATRAALTLHQARRNNMADVSAKDGSQETLVNLAGLICSILLVPIVTGRHMLIWTLYVAFTSLHLYANYSAVTCVIMETISQSRLKIIVGDYLTNGSVPFPKPVNYKEPVVLKTSRRFKIKLGCSVQSLCESPATCDELLRIYENNRYILWVDYKSDTIYIVLDSSSSERDQLQACLQAELINWVHEQGQAISGVNHQFEGVEGILQKDVNGLSSSYLFVKERFSKFVSQLHERGWKTDTVLLGADEWRLGTSGMSAAGKLL